MRSFILQHILDWSHGRWLIRFSDLKLLDQIATIQNARGIIALSPDSSSLVLACPGVTKGSVRVELYDLRKTQLIPAHESEVAALALTNRGDRLATASNKGTLIRVFDTHNGAILKELRRGEWNRVAPC
jgi:WD40 repeat protein